METEMELGGGLKRNISMIPETFSPWKASPLWSCFKPWMFFGIHSLKPWDLAPFLQGDHATHQLI